MTAEQKQLAMKEMLKELSKKKDKVLMDRFKATHAD
jgi:hypothetical protein